VAPRPILAVHDTCTEPGCRVAAVVCDLDHAVPVDDDGPTDVANLAPVCATGNHRKETDGWTATQQADGTRTWTHHRTGISTTTRPGTWRTGPDRRRSPLERRLHRMLRRDPPAPRPRPPRRGPPDRSDPPGGDDPPQPGADPPEGATDLPF
jgi:hypothetical protein